MAQKPTYINEQDFLNDGRKKINDFAIDTAYRAEVNSEAAIKNANTLGNKAISDANKLGNEAKATAKKADDQSLDAIEIAKNTNDNMNNIINGNTDDAEIIAARKPFGEEASTTLGERLDNQFGKNEEFRPEAFSVNDKIKNELSDRGINVLWFYNYYSDEKKHTEMFNQAIKRAAELETYVFAPDGFYEVYGHDSATSSKSYLRGVGGIEVLSGTTIIMSDNAVIKVIPNSSRAYCVFNIHDKENVLIKGGTIVGDQEEHDFSDTSSTHEWGYGVQIQGGKNIKIESLKAINFTGDGINIQRCERTVNDVYYYPRDIYINNVSCLNNGRQGMSIEEGSNVFVENSEFSYTNRTNPSCGIDIEPAWTGDSVCENITIRKCEFKFNRVGGIGILGDYQNGEFRTKNIRIVDCYFEGNGNHSSGWGSAFTSGKASNVFFANNHLADKQIIIINSTKNGIVRSNYLENGCIAQDDSYTTNQSSIILDDNDINYLTPHYYYKALLTIQKVMTKLIVKGNVWVNESGQNNVTLNVKIVDLQYISNTIIGGLNGFLFTGDKALLLRNTISGVLGRFAAGTSTNLTISGNNVTNTKSGILLSMVLETSQHQILDNDIYLMDGSEVVTIDNLAARSNTKLSLINMRTNLKRNISFDHNGKFASGSFINFVSSTLNTIPLNTNYQELPQGSIIFNPNDGALYAKVANGGNDLKKISLE